MCELCGLNYSMGTIVQQQLPPHQKGLLRFQIAAGAPAAEDQAATAAEINIQAPFC